MTIQLKHQGAVDRKIRSIERHLWALGPKTAEELAREFGRSRTWVLYYLDLAMFAGKINRMSHSGFFASLGRPPYLYFSTVPGAADEPTFVDALERRSH